jgi:hypothetical protein
MLIYPYLVLSDKSEVFFKFFCNFAKNLAYISMASPTNVLAKLNNEFDMSSALLHLLFEGGWRKNTLSNTSLLIQFNVFLYIIKLRIYAVYLLPPFSRIYLTFKYLVINFFGFMVLCIIISLLIGIEKIDFSLFSIGLHSVFLGDHSASKVGELINNEVSTFSYLNLATSTIQRNHTLSFRAETGFFSHFVSFLFEIYWNYWLLKLKFSSIQLQVKKLIYYCANMFAPTRFKLFRLDIFCV